MALTAAGDIQYRKEPAVANLYMQQAPVVCEGCYTCITRDNFGEAYEEQRDDTNLFHYEIVLFMDCTETPNNAQGRAVFFRWHPEI